MTYFTTEMVFLHPPRQPAGRYTGARVMRYGCRTQARTPSPARARTSAGAAPQRERGATTAASAFDHAA